MFKKENKLHLPNLLHIKTSYVSIILQISCFSECAQLIMYVCSLNCVCVSAPSGVVQYLDLDGKNAGGRVCGLLHWGAEVLPSQCWWHGLWRSLWLCGCLHHTIHRQGQRNRAPRRIHVQLHMLSGGWALCNVFHHGVSRFTIQTFSVL